MTADRVHRYIVAYDISSDLRRVRVAATLDSYGDRVQYSVFLVDAKPAKLMRLRAAVTAQIDFRTDSVLICDLGTLPDRGTNHIEVIGLSRSFTGQGPLVL